MIRRIGIALAMHSCMILGAALMLGAGPAQADSWQLVVRNTEPTIEDLPLVVEVTPRLPVGNYAVEVNGTKSHVIAQVFGDGTKRWMGCVLPANLAGGTYTLRPQLSLAQTAAAGFQFIPRGSNLTVLLDGTMLTEYRTDAGAKPFLFPLVGPTGVSYTRAFPMESLADEDHDHPHQRSFWFTHGKVNGVDFWSETEVHGTIKETARKCVVSGSVLGRLLTTDDWIDHDGKKVCEDERSLTFFKTASGRLIDLEITLKATAGPVTFGDTKEGMFGLRVASSMDVDRKRGGRIVNAEGLTDSRAWGKSSAWVDYSGPVNGKTVGIAILNHPRSFRYPTTWHVRTYGLFAANPFGWHDFGMAKPGDFTLPKGERIWFGYRVILHEGEASLSKLASWFNGYRFSPQIDVKEQ